MRVHELAKELKLESKAFISILKEMGISVKSHMSSLSEEQIGSVRKKLSKTAPAPAKSGGKESLKEVAEKVVRKASKKAPEKVVKNAPEKTKESPAESIEDASQRTLIEKRISRTVIRRRKKVEPEPFDLCPEIEEQVERAEKETEEKKPEPPALPETSEKPAEHEKRKKPEPKTVKKKAKESTPARIVDRIDLPSKKQDKKEDASEVKAEETITETVDKQKTFDNAIKDGLKDKSKQQEKQKKFIWQKESLDAADRDKDTVIHRKKRYKVQEKPAKLRRRKGEVISFSQRRQTVKTVPKAIKREIHVHDGITLTDLAKRMGIKANKVIKKLLDLGVSVTINQMLDVDTAALVAGDFGYEVKSVSIDEETIFEEQSKESGKNLKSRSPIVTVMGHVDHGKTTLLDAIRNTNVTAGEKGGITQHIGAYRVSLNDSDIAFVDTPGHEAFTEMRARGASVTDIVILVVAAEEGVKPQTIEAINHAKAAEVPVIVAVNKMDKPDANSEKVKQALSNYGLVQEEWGGDTIFVEVSAKKKQGIAKLLEMVLLQAEMLELKANPDKPARGIIIEARVDRGRGPIATVMVQEGTLKVGDSFVSRHAFGKVRALIDDRDRKANEAGPSTPVEVVGFSDAPESGDIFIVVDEKKARQTSSYWQLKKRQDELRKDTKVSLENFLSTVEEQDTKELRIVLKADVNGSLEALSQSLQKLNTDEVKINIIHSSVGAISLNDVMLASASNAVIIGFGVKIAPKIHGTAGLEGVDVRLYDIIYEVIEDVTKAMLGLLAPDVIEKSVGKAEIREVFSISKYGTVAGCMVVEGKIVNGSKARLIRASETIHECEITSLKRFKEDAKEVLSGQDCGIYLGSFKDFETGDVIESFFTEEVKRTVL